MKKLINNWLAIMNISIAKEFGKSFLLPILPNENDDCMKIPLDNCTSNNICNIYTNSKKEKNCVNKNRIKKFQKDTNIIGKNGKSYNIIEASLFDFGCNGTGIECYYYFVRENNDEYIYILFNDGIVLPYVKLFDEDMYNDFEYIIETMKKYPDCKFILSGHSMGCTLAQCLGLYIIRHYPDFFKDYCYIIGTGQSRWLPKKLEQLYKTYNYKIRIFVTSNEGENNLINIDSFFFSGTKFIIQTFPCILLYTLSNKYQVIEDDTNLVETVGDNAINNLHNFETYSKLIKKVYLS